MSLNEYVTKAWGHENIWCSNEKYCGKLLHFKSGTKFSMHFHKEKDETWYVMDGVFEVSFIDTRTAELRTSSLTCGDVWRNEPCEPHQLKCLKEGTIIEVSTPDSVEDTYRVFPGDNQK